VREEVRDEGTEVVRVGWLGFDRCWCLGPEGTEFSPDGRDWDGSPQREVSGGNIPRPEGDAGNYAVE